jgi:hypothetical protein
MTHTKEKRLEKIIAVECRRFVIRQSANSGFDYQFHSTRCGCMVRPALVMSPAASSENSTQATFKWLHGVGFSSLNYKWKNYKTNDNFVMTKMNRG